MVLTLIFLDQSCHLADDGEPLLDFRPDIDSLICLGQPYCNPYTNSNWTVGNEAIDIWAALYEGEVPYNHPDSLTTTSLYQLRDLLDLLPNQRVRPYYAGFH